MRSINTRIIEHFEYVDISEVVNIDRFQVLVEREVYQGVVENFGDNKKKCFVYLKRQLHLILKMNMIKFKVMMLVVDETIIIIKNTVLENTNTILITKGDELNAIT